MLASPRLLEAGLFPHAGKTISIDRVEGGSFFGGHHKSYQFGSHGLAFDANLRSVRGKEGRGTTLHPRDKDIALAVCRFMLQKIEEKKGGGIKIF